MHFIFIFHKAGERRANARIRVRGRIVQIHRTTTAERGMGTIAADKGVAHNLSLYNTLWASRPQTPTKHGD